MAEGLLKQMLVDESITGCFVSSAGLNALLGHRPDPSACLMMKRKGIDISSYRACQLDNNMIRKADLILVMELTQKIAIEEKEPSARGKIFRLGEWGKFDIADPYQKGLPIFEKSLVLIEQGVSQWVKKM